MATSAHFSWTRIAAGLALGAAVLFVLQDFLRPMLWALVLATASWPAYARMASDLRSRTAAAAFMVLGLFLGLVLPLYIIAGLLSYELHALIQGVTLMNDAGVRMPGWLAELGAGFGASAWWNANLGAPGGLARLIQGALGHGLPAITDLLAHLSGDLVRRMLGLFFALVTLFFCYRHGTGLLRQANALGERLLPGKFGVYQRAATLTVRGTVAGMVVLALFEGVALGIAYVLVGAPSPLLLAVVSGCLALVPLGSPVAFGSVALLLWAKGSGSAALALLAWGMFEAFMVDHVFRPALVGGAARLPFLAVLFGILGGVSALGLIGIFVGPVVLALGMVAWRDATRQGHPPALAPRAASDFPPKASGRR